jgi:hypothetical protein
MKVFLRLFLFITLLGYCLVVPAQTTITVKAGTRVIDYFPFQERYRYPEFIQGKVQFRNGMFTAAKLNYNILLGEMQFIQKRDTLAIGNVKDIDHVEIDLDTFYFDNGYLEILAGNGRATMAVKQYVKFMDVKKSGAYGDKNSTGAIDTYSSVTLGQGNRNYKLIINEDIVLSRNTEYYIGDPQNGFLPYRKNYITRLFPQQRSEIENYLKRNPVDFKEEDDLLRLTGFLIDL